MRIPLAFLALAALPACGGSGDGRFQIQLLRRATDGQYVAAQPGDDLDVLLGFQGYQFIKMKARLTGSAPAELDLDLVLSIDGMPDFPEDLAMIPVAPGEPRLTNAFYVYLNHIDPLSDVIGRHARLAFTPRGGAADAVTIEGTLTNRPGCIEQFDASIKCGP